MVPAVLRSIYVDRKTGMLRFIRDDERRSIRFMSGHVVYGQASVTELHLGEVLIAEGRLDRPTLVRERPMSVATMQATSTRQREATLR